MNHPQLGKVYQDATRTEVRYVTLPRTQRKLYYLLRSDEVVFMGAWGARRKRGPTF